MILSSGFCVRLEFARSQIRILRVAELLLIRGLFFLLIHLIELLFGRVLASACEAQIRLCVKGRQTSLSNSESVKSQKMIDF